MGAKVLRYTGSDGDERLQFGHFVPHARRCRSRMPPFFDRVIVTAEFCHQARMIRAALGMPDLYTAVTDPSAEPQSTLTDARGE